MLLCTPGFFKGLLLGKYFFSFYHTGEEIKIEDLSDDEVKRF